MCVGGRGGNFDGVWRRKNEGGRAWRDGWWRWWEKVSVEGSMGKAVIACRSIYCWEVRFLLFEHKDVVIECCKPMYNISSSGKHAASVETSRFAMMKMSFLETL